MNLKVRFITQRFLNPKIKIVLINHCHIDYLTKNLNKKNRIHLIDSSK